MLNQGIGFVLIAAITSVPFYFQYWLKSQANVTPAEIDARVSRLTLVIFGALILYSWLGVGSHDQSASYLGLGASVIAFTLLYSFRGKESNQRRNVRVTPQDRLQQNFRTITAMGFIFATYAGTFHGLNAFAPTLFAIVGALLATVAAAPLMIRVLFPCTIMAESSLKRGFKAVFDDAKSPISEVFILNTNKIKVSNALVCGSRFGMGPTRRTLFLSENLFHLLSENELNSVLCHEAAHFQLHHLAKRAGWILAGMLFAVAVTSIPVTAVTLLFRHVPSVQWALNISLVVLNLFIQFWMIARVIKRQELEADAQAVKLGATPKTLISALEKITHYNGSEEKPRDFLTQMTVGSFHPSFEERKAALTLNSQKVGKDFPFREPSILPKSSLERGLFQ